MDFSVLISSSIGLNFLAQHLSQCAKLQRIFGTRHSTYDPKQTLYFLCISLTMNKQHFMMLRTCYKQKLLIFSLPNSNCVSQKSLNKKKIEELTQRMPNLHIPLNQFCCNFYFVTNFFFQMQSNFATNFCTYEILIIFNLQHFYCCYN